MSAAVEAVAEGIADAHNDGMEARDPYWRHSLPTKSQDWTFEAKAALAFIRDAIYRDGDDADAIREALGLTWDEFLGTPRQQPARRIVGEWQTQAT